MSWHTARLSDVCHFENGDRGKNYPGKSALLDDGIPFVNAGDLQEGVVRLDGLSFIAPSHYEKLSNGKFSQGDFLFCLRGSLGKFAYVNRAIKGAIASSLIIIRPQDGLHPDYLKHYLGSGLCEKEIALHANGAAQPNLAASSLKQFKIPLPSLDEQKRIAVILDKADQLRQKRRQAIALLDTLTQSIFLEMFGDPVSNPKGWALATLGDVIHQASDGPHVSPQYSDEGVPFLSTRHVARGRIIWQDLKHISEEDAKIHWRKCKPERGDVLYTKGGTTGIAAHVDFDEPFAVWVHVALLKTKHDVVSPKWLECMLNGNYCYQQSQTYTHGIANRDLGLKRMVKIKIFVPPLERQVEFIERTNALAHVIQQAELQSTDTDSLFASLQHRAFSGQL